MSKPTVAIVGASPYPEKYSNKSVRAHLKRGFEVYPVNPRGGQIEGLKVYRSLSELPTRTLTRISLYVPPEIGIRLLPQIAAIDCEEVWLNPGSESETLISEVRRLGIEPIIACSIIDLGMQPGSC